MAPRRPSADERALWRDAVRDVSPLGPAASPPEAEAEAETPAPAPRQPAAPSKAPSAAPRPTTGPAGTGLDRRSAQRLKRGQMAVEARLDLHGLTQAEAHGALLRFIARAQGDGLRAVLIITGKGSAGGEGVLRRAVPLWLAAAECGARVLATAAAQPKDGGSGALYVLLRRRRAAT